MYRRINAPIGYPRKNKFNPQNNVTMQANEVIARLEGLVADGTITTTIYKLSGNWSSILVKVDGYNGNEIVTVIDNKGAEYINRQIARLDAALHPERYNHYWEITEEPRQLPTLPMEIAFNG